MTGPAQQPSLGVGQRPPVGSAGNRPGVGNGPGVGNRPVDPGFGNRPGVGVGQGPGIGQGPGVGNRPGVGQGPGVGNRPATLPGLGVGVGAGLGGAALAGRRQDNIQNRGENLNDRSQNLQDRMQNRQDVRQQALENRQDSLENRREDWQSWHDDYYGHHGGWYHGAWCDHWGDYWSHMWSDHTAAMVLGTTMWGLNRMDYWFGTADYVNPYYTEPLVVDNTTIYYSEPLAAPPAVAAAAVADPVKQPSEFPPGVTAEGLKQFDTARAAFYAGKYEDALTAANKALAAMPNDAVVHEFRALTLFALGKYHDAATTLHPVLAVGPGWDWTTMSSLYPSAETYTGQLRALETNVKSNPNAADARFVLAYHYLTCGHEERAAAEFKKIQSALPNDALTGQLAKMLSKADAAAPSPESTVKIDPAGLFGTWTASRGTKANFELTLGKDKSFTWIYRGGKTPLEAKGAYAIDGNVLALEPDAGGVMLAEITAPQNGTFDFRTVDAPQSDPGLKFRQK
jgi:tetratricopeptide (TPR) repeat protein